VKVLSKNVSAMRAINYKVEKDLKKKKIKLVVTLIQMKAAVEGQD
jgi:hypothetical protein